MAVRLVALLQTANFLGDTVAVQACAYAVSWYCLITDWTSAASRSLSAALLSLGDDLLRSVMRQCATRRSAEAVLALLPFGLHPPFLASQIEHCDGGKRLCLAVPDHDRRTNPASRLRAAPFCASACTALCAQLPLLRNLLSVDLSGCLLDEHQVTGAVQALECRSQLRELSLARCTICHSGAHALAAALPQWRLQALDLADMADLLLATLQSAEPFINIIASTLRRQTALTRLTLRDFWLTPDLAAAIAPLTELRHLDVSKCTGQDGPGGRLDALQHLRRLTHFDISRSAWCLDLAPLAACTELRVLGAAAGRFGVATTDWAALRGLERLDISGVAPVCALGATQAQAWVDALSSLSHLTEIVLGRDDGDSDGPALDVVDALVAMTALRVLRARSPFRNLAQVWPWTPQLTTLQCELSRDATLLGEHELGAAPEGPARLAELQQLDMKVWWAAGIGEDGEGQGNNDDDVVPNFDWLPDQLTSLTSLTALQLRQGNATHTHLQYCHELVEGAGGAISGLLELRVHGADLRFCARAALLPLAIPGLTLLELQHCVVDELFTQCLVIGALTSLLLMHCSLSDDEVRVLSGNFRALSVLDVTGNILRDVETAKWLVEGLNGSATWWFGFSFASNAAACGDVKRCVDSFNQSYADEKECVCVISEVSYV